MRDFLFARRRILFFLALMLGSVALRWPVLDRQIWNLDEGSTTTLAELVLDGQLLFRDGADNRTPLVPYVKAAILAVSGHWNMRAIHVAVALMAGATAVLVWQIGRRLGRESAGVFAALACFWLSAGFVSPGEGLSSHTSWFVIFFSALGFWFFADALRRLSPWAAGAAGVSFGLSYLAKQPGLLDFGVCLVIIGLAGIARDPARAWRLLPALVLGFLLPLAGTIAYFAHHGALDDLIFYSWTYNTQYYVPELPLELRLRAINVPWRLLSERVPAALVLGVVAAGGMTVVAFRRLAARAPLAAFEWLALGWSATGLLSTLLSGRQFEHYAIQLIPGLSLACGWVLALAADRVVAWWREHRRIAAGAVAAGIAAVFATLAIRTIGDIALVDRNDEGNNPAIGRLIQQRSRPADRLFIWGYMPEMYVFAQRLPATRYYYTNWVTGLIPWTNVDWLKDTAYAIIPGTPEILEADLERNHPALILDTGGLRGYYKYPLRHQPRLAARVARDFAEIEPGLLNPSGFRLYQRCVPASPATAWPDASPDPRVTLATVATANPENTAVTVGYPAGTTSLELYKDGRLYRQLALPPEQAGTAIFTLLGSDLAVGERRLQALARGRELLASSPATLRVHAPEPFVPNGPRLTLYHQEYPPLVAERQQGPVGAAENGWWSASAPARFVYERLPHLYGIEVEFKMSDVLGDRPERWKTDGIEVAIGLETASGRRTLLYRQGMDACHVPADRGLKKVRVLLPADQPGRPVILFSPGHVSDASCDWVWIKSVRGLGPPLNLSHRGELIAATSMDAPMGFAPLEQQGAKVLMAHAPSAVEIPYPVGAQRLSGVLGMLAEAWTGPKGSAGAAFEIWHVPPEGEPKQLLNMIVDPVHHEDNRGLLAFTVPLPAGATGLLRLTTRAAHPQDNSFNYTYWGELRAKTAAAEIVTPGAPIPCTTIEAKHGHDEFVVGGRVVTFVHSPSRLVFPVDQPYARLRGELGLMPGAYAPGESTDGARFLVEWEDDSGRSTVLWQRDLDPQNVAADRGFIPFSVDLPKEAKKGRLILSTDARPDRAYTRSWTFWHGLTLEP
jgi:hypothetical protein